MTCLSLFQGIYKHYLYVFDLHHALQECTPAQSAILDLLAVP